MQWQAPAIAVSWQSERQLWFVFWPEKQGRKNKYRQAGREKNGSSRWACKQNFQSYRDSDSLMKANEIKSSQT